MFTCLLLALVQTAACPATCASASFQPPAAERAASENVDLTPRLKPSDSLSLMWHRRIERATPRGTVNTPELSQPVTIRVVEINEQGPVVEWSWGRIEVEGVPRPPEAELDPAVALLENQKYQLQLNADWSFASLRDPEALFARVDAVAAIEDARPLPEAVDEASAKLREAVDKSRQLARELRLNRQVLIGNFVREPVAYLTGLAWQIPPQGTWRFSFKKASPLDGAEFTVHWDVAISKYDPHSPTVTLLFEQHYDPEEFRRVLEKSAREMAKKLGDDGADAITIDIDEHEEAMHVIERVTGWSVRGGWMRVRRDRDVTTLTIIEWEPMPAPGPAAQPGQK